MYSFKFDKTGANPFNYRAADFLKNDHTFSNVSIFLKDISFARPHVQPDLKYADAIVSVSLTHAGFKGKPAIGLFFLRYNTENVGQGQ